MAMEMAIRASPTLRLSHSQLSLSNSKTFSKPHFPNSHHSLPLLGFGISTRCNQVKAQALPKEQIVSSITQVENTLDQVQQLSSNFFDTTSKAVQAVISALKPAVEATFPVAKQAGEEALKIASPVVSEVSKQAQEAIESSGVSTEPIVTAAKTVVDAASKTGEVAKPLASSAVETIVSAEPITLVGSAGALVVAYFLLPPVWSLISFKLRGYQGDLTPAQTLDLVSTKNYVLVDIRSEKDKDKAGIPRLPSSAKSKMISIPLEELPSKLKGVVRNGKKLEAEIAALKISFLKRVNQGSNIVILDSYADSAKIVAKTLTSLGFNNCWVVADGFSGGRGWLQSRLGTDSYNFSFAEVISPSRVISATKRFGTTTTSAPSGQKLLPE